MSNRTDTRALLRAFADQGGQWRRTADGHLVLYGRDGRLIAKLSTTKKAHDGKTLTGVKVQLRRESFTV